MLTFGGGLTDPDDVDRLFSDWRPGAIFPSELIWFAQQVQARKAEVVIECGRQDGVSTRALGSILGSQGVEIVSIDFDDDPVRAASVRESLRDLPVTCVSGDIRSHVPSLLQRFNGRRIAVLQDGPKGWQGLAVTLAAALDPAVVVAARHNLHLGHQGRVADATFESLWSRCGAS